MSSSTNFERSNPELYELYTAMPVYTPELAIRCPVRNLDGTPATEICGCGSTNVEWDGDVYDCLDCGIFFADFAADPPHRRQDRGT